jgi:hypothetical protein
MGNCIELDCIVLQSRKRAVLLQGTLYFSKLSKEKYRFREMASIYFDSDPTEHLQAHIPWNRRRIQLDYIFGLLSLLQKSHRFHRKKAHSQNDDDTRSRIQYYTTSKVGYKTKLHIVVLHLDTQLSQF